MLFPTTVFAVFFLIVFAGGWLLAGRRRAWLLFMLLASYVFYGWWDWRFLALILFCTLLNHGAALWIAGLERRGARRAVLILTLACDLGLLGFFKYYRFFVLSAYSLFARVGITPSFPLLEIILPVGISFFTFQAISYVMDVYRRDIAPAESLLAFGTYLAFFPQLVAGPIVRSSVFLPQIHKHPDPRQVDAGRAATLILTGLFKKMVLANLLARMLADPLFGDPEGYGALDAVFGVYGYALQIYCDFSAYSDIAIGVALLLGIRFPDNFNAPYVSVSFREFWRRWHISLSSWLRDYLYIPLGGSRGRAWRTGGNVMITFLLGGLWHGAQWRFVAWGALHGFYLILERMLSGVLTGKLHTHSRLWRAAMPLAKGVIVFHGVCLSWVFFRAETFGDAWLILESLLRWGAPSLPTWPALGVLVAAFAVQALDGNRAAAFHAWFNRRNFVLQGLLVALILTVIIALGPSGVAPFIYFQF